jgi:hypothetical protein
MELALDQIVLLERVARQFKDFFLFFLLEDVNNKPFNTCNLCITERIRYQCSKTTVLSCRKCIINNDAVKMNNIYIDYNFDHQMSLSMSKCWYSNNCLYFLRCSVPL